MCNGVAFESSTLVPVTSTTSTTSTSESTIVPDVFIPCGAAAARHHYFFSFSIAMAKKSNLLLIRGTGKQIYLFLFDNFNLALKLPFIAHHYFAFLFP
jgi:hypothetical protein